MKYVTKLIKWFSSDTKYFPHYQASEFDYRILPCLPPPDHLIEPEVTLVSNKRYTFAEMFDCNGNFEAAYLSTECNYLTYITSFPGEALFEPGPIKLEISFGETVCTLGHFNADSLGMSSTIQFYDSGMAKHTIKEYSDSEIISVKEGWYDRQTSNNLYSEFESFKFEEWQDDFTDGFIMFDGGEWGLTVIYEDGTSKQSHGFIGNDETANWQQIRSFFNFPSTFNRRTNNKTSEESSSEIGWSTQRKNLLKYIAIYLVLPFTSLLLFMLWVWIYFGMS